MALFNWFCTCIFFLLVSVIQAQSSGNSDCYVNNTNPVIEENNPPGLVIANITTAPDVTVTIDTTSQHHDWFEINGTQLILKTSVDYEETMVLIVNLKCLKGGMEIADLPIIVQVDNLNDNPPQFKETNITVNVNEDTKVNTIIVPQANVTATDADGNVLSYSLTGRPPEATDYFNIQGVNNPQIYLLRVLDYEKINFAELILYAVDGNANASGSHTASATINIYVIPADLRPPLFQPCTFTAGGKLCINLGYTGTVNISETATEPLILQPGPLYAIDGDKYLNEKIAYDLVEGNDDDTFTINTDTGNITMNKPVTILKTFILHVMASQVNNPFKYAQTTVQIKVVYKNDHKPNFEKTSYKGTVSVGLPVPSPVIESGTLSTPLKIFAADKDFPDEINPNIEYKISNSTDFSVTADGFILTAKVLNLASTVTFLAIAYDKESQQEENTLITVDVTPLTTTTILPTTVTTTTMTPTTTTVPVTSGLGTIISKPSSSSTHLPPGTNSSLPTIPPGSTTTTPTTTTTTAAASVTSGLGTSISKPSTHLPPGANSSLPTIPPGSTTTTPITTTTAAAASVTPGLGTSVSKPSTHLPPGANSSLPTIPPGSTTITPTSMTMTTTTTTAATVTPGLGTSMSKPSTHLPPETNSSLPTIPPGSTTIPPTTITMITTTTAAASVTPGLGTSISKPSSSSTHLTPGTNSSLPTIPPALTKSTTPPISTTSNIGITEITGNPVTSTKPGSNIPPFVTTVKPPIITSNVSPQTTNSFVTGISQTTVGIVKSTTSQSGTTKPSTTVISTSQNIYPTSSRTETTKPSLPTASPATDGTGQATTTTSQFGTNNPQIPGVGKMYSREDMAALGATLGCLLAISLVLLGLISYKYYVQPMKHKHGEDHVRSTDGFTNYNYQTDEKPNLDEKDDMSEASVLSENDDNTMTQEQQVTQTPVEKAMESSQASAAPDALEEGEENEEETDTEKEVRSILTKDRKVADDGYKAVWFKEDIDPEAKDDVVMIEEDSDVEQNRDGSDGDNEDGDREDDVRDSDDNNEGDDDDDDDDDDDNDSDQGRSDVSFIPGRAWISKTDPTTSQSHEDTEEHDIFL